MLLSPTSFVIALSLSIAPSPTPLQRDAQAAWDRADAHAAVGDHDDAVAEYARAWQDVEAHAILYSWAQSERLRGHCIEAAALYERFVAEGQTPPESYDTELLRAQWSNMLANAERQREACRAPAATATEILADPLPAPTAPPPDATRVEPRRPVSPPPRPWWRDAAGWSLASTGAAALLTGVVLVVVADQQDRRAAGLGSHQAFDDAIDRAIVEQRVGLGLLGLGGALTIAGIVRFAIVARRTGRNARPVTLDFSPRGAALCGRF